VNSAEGDAKKRLRAQERDGVFGRFVGFYGMPFRSITPPWWPMNRALTLSLSPSDGERVTEGRVRGERE